MRARTRAQAAAAFATVRHQAEHDPLTGLLNRARFSQSLQEALDARETGTVVAVLFVDLDDFKVVNDSLGHGAGDELRIQVAGVMRNALRPGDVLGRFGGDEFVVCLSADSSDVAERVAGRVRASTGVAIADDSDARAEALIRDADAAMYVAKRRGKGRVQTYDGGLRADAIDRRSRVPGTSHTLSLGRPGAGRPEQEAADNEAELTSILRDGAIRSVYQPIVELDGRAAIGYEARARGPQGSALERPDLLFDAARVTGRVVELDWACRAAAIAGARAAGIQRPHKVFINVEPSALGSPCPDALATE